VTEAAESDSDFKKMGFQALTLGSELGIFFNFYLQN